MDEKERFNIVFAGLVGGEQHLFHSNPEFHAGVTQAAQLVIRVVDDIIKPDALKAEQRKADALRLANVPEREGGLTQCPDCPEVVYNLYDHRARAHGWGKDD